jgi:two-component system cell cycle response regulator DivK
MNNTILIIEDNADNFYLMRFLLENSGFDVVGSDTGMDGIKKALDLKPKSILLDIQLPEMDGYAVARELAKHSELKGIPIIAVTSYAMVGDRERALEAGATAYMEKPIDPDTFVSEIIRYMSFEHSRQGVDDENTHS